MFRYFNHDPAPMIRDPAEAVAHRGRMMAQIEPIPVLAAAVGERLAIRDPSGEWTVQVLSGAVRLYLRTGPDSHVSKYVWHWRNTDATIDHLLGLVPESPKDET